MWRRQEVDTLESIKKDIKKIRRAGISAEILGFVMLFGASALIWIVKTQLLVIVILGCALIFGLFFIITGNYLKDGRGRRTKFALLLNAIVSFPLSVGILPLFVCVKSMNNYSRFKELPDNIQSLYSKPKPLSIRWWEIVLLVGAVIAGSGSTILRFQHLHKIVNKTSAISVQTAPQIDTVALAKFAISFPGPVNATNLTEQVADHSVNYTIFDSHGDSGTADYEVYVYNFPEPFFNYATMSPADLVNAVHATLLANVQALHGTIAKDTPATFLGRPSDEAAFTSQTIGGSTSGYMRVLFIGNIEYSIFTLKATQDEFTNFANSFEYKGT